jgi:hypothetical protein
MPMLSPAGAPPLVMKVMGADALKLLGLPKTSVADNRPGRFIK